VAQAERRFTTRELLATERRVLDSAEQARSERSVVPVAVVDRVLARRGALAAEQARMVHRLTEGAEAIVVVSGRAGTGKTFALAAAREAWEASGVTVLGAAVARRAARELELGAGIDSTSVHALLMRLDRGQRLPDRCVLVLDEAGMLGTRQLARVLDHITAAGGKLVLVGDHRQLPELEAGGTFRALARRPAAIRLEENRRQLAGWERDALNHLREGRAEAALDLYTRHRRLRTSPTSAEARTALIDDWWSAGDHDHSLIIARTRSDVAELNRLARRRMAAAGALGSDEVPLFGQRFAAGDPVVIRRNDLGAGLHNGDRCRVIGVDARRLRMVVTADGRRDPIELDARFLLHRTERGDPPIAHGYAVTGHIAQGMTVDRTFVLAGPRISREWAYAALSRGRAENRIYAAGRDEQGRDEFAPGERPQHRLSARDQLSHDLARSDAQPLTLDQLGRARQRGIEL
jgi:ATP-dependent exoDNAse (exonuclease V) alpha subunit